VFSGGTSTVFVLKFKKFENLGFVVLISSHFVVLISSYLMTETIRKKTENSDGQLDPLHV
jgi:hypothetical protein